MGRDRLAERVAAAAEAALDQDKYVSAIDVMMGIGWLPQSVVDVWRRGRLPYLEQGIQVDLSKLSTALQLLRGWATERGLQPSETEYVSATRDRQPLRFSASGDDEVERAYRTYWLSPELKGQSVQRQRRAPDLVVIEPLRDWNCSLCVGGGGFLIMEASGPVCMTCADMEHLVFLPAGDAALSRRAKQGSRLSAVVVRFSRSRHRYERQGILVEEAALEKAETENLADADARERRRQREAERRATEDLALSARMAEEIRRLYPGCPETRARAIARRATVRGSGRVGRSAAGRGLDADAITLAVLADIRHQDTRYDQLLAQGALRGDARELVRAEVDQVQRAWRRG